MANKTTTTTKTKPRTVEIYEDVSGSSNNLKKINSGNPIDQKNVRVNEENEVNAYQQSIDSDDSDNDSNLKKKSRFSIKRGLVNKKSEDQDSNNSGGNGQEQSTITSNNNATLTSYSKKLLVNSQKDETKVKVKDTDMDTFPKRDSKANIERKKSNQLNGSVQAENKPVKRRTITEIIGNMNKNNDKNKPSFSSHNEYESQKQKASANGLSVIYGLLLFFVGVFLSLDIYAGQLGDKRTVNTVFYSLLYGVSIIWILFMYVDIRKYSKELKEFIEEVKPMKPVDPPKFHPTSMRRKSMMPTDAIDISNYGNLTDFTSKKSGLYSKHKEKYSGSTLSPISETSFDNYNVTNDHPAAVENAYYTESMIYGFGKCNKKMFDAAPKRYLNDKNASYNLYLRAGIGIFCMVSLLQSAMDIVEAFENGLDCQLDNHEAIVSCLQLIFSSLQFLFLFTRGALVINSRKLAASFLIMHLTVTNLIIWFKNILLESMNEFYTEQLEENLAHLESATNATAPHARKVIDESIRYLIQNAYETYKDSFSNQSTTVTELVSQAITNLTASLTLLSTPTTTHDAHSMTTSIGNTSNDDAWKDCYRDDDVPVQKLSMRIKPYLYPATIEFSVTCATLFGIMWTRIGSSNSKHRTLFAVQTHSDESVYQPNPGMLVMLDCTKTSRGLFFGILVFVGTILSAILFLVYNETEGSRYIAALISQLTECTLLVIALFVTLLAYWKVKRTYDEVTPHMNVFDVVLEVLSMCGVYAFGINSLIAIFYSFNEGANSHKSTATEGAVHKPEDFANKVASACVAILSIIQGTVQTIFILECLRRYATKYEDFLKKPARELITVLLLINISMWFYDTVSAKRFEANAFIVEHFHVLKWSIINAFSSPLAVFYRFHSSVCLSDIWYGLYYGELEGEEHGLDEMEEECITDADAISNEFDDF